MFKGSLVPAKQTGNFYEFNFNGNKIRVVAIEGKPWFVATEISSTLGYVNPHKAVIDHCKYAKILKPHESLGLTNSPRGINIIPESDLFRLTMRSDLESAEKFQDWVYEEVLPAIRQTGSYSVQPQFQIPQTLSEALRLAADLAEDKARLELENKALTPKAESFDSFMAGENTHLIGVVAKALGTGQNKLFQFLRDKKILIDSGDKYNTPYQQYIDAGYFDVIYRSVERGTHKKNHAVTKVTAKGVDFISKQLKTKTVITAK
jgi:prophage antirepressor-like protein